MRSTANFCTAPLTSRARASTTTAKRSSWSAKRSRSVAGALVVVWSAPWLLVTPSPSDSAPAPSLERATSALPESLAALIWPPFCTATMPTTSATTSTAATGATTCHQRRLRRGVAAAAGGSKNSLRPPQRSPERSV